MFNRKDWTEGFNNNVIDTSANDVGISILCSSWAATDSVEPCLADEADNPNK